MRLQKTGSKTTVELIRRMLCPVKDSYFQIWGGAGAGCNGTAWGERVRGSYSTTCFLWHHCDYDTLRTLASEAAPTRRLRFFTQLREPVSRAMSEYRHVVGRSENPWKPDPEYLPVLAYPNGTKFDAGSAEDFLAFARHPANAPGMRSRQTRMLADRSGCPRPPPMTTANVATAFMTSTAVEMVAASYEDYEECLLASALGILETMPILLLERFAESLFVLSRAMGTVPPLEFRRYSEGLELEAPPLQLTDAQRAAAAADNAADVRLYVRAQRLVDDRWAAAFGASRRLSRRCHYACAVSLADEAAITARPGAPRPTATCKIPPSCLEQFFPTKVAG
ncbi:unnamed protein product [Phaeothamnion confervicola]